MIFGIHKMLLDTGLWTVYKSSAFVGGGQTAGLGNLFSPTYVASEWVYHAVNHSWCTYYNVGLGIYLTLDCNAPIIVSQGYAPELWCAPGEPTGAGTISARPTHAFEWGYSDGTGAGQFRLISGSPYVPHFINMVYSSRGDFWLWAYELGETLETFGMACTKIADPDPVVGDNYPTITYAYFDNAYGAFASGPLLGGNYRAWKGRTGGGALVDYTYAPYIHFNGLVRWDATGGNTPISPYLYWPGEGANRHKHLITPFDLYVSDVSAIYTDYKGRLPDVEIGPYLARGTPREQTGTVTRRSIDNLWLPGMPTAGPSKG
jgi:hypothetical protein